jgi:hypothetical protein
MARQSIRSPRWGRAQAIALAISIATIPVVGCRTKSSISSGVTTGARSSDSLDAGGLATYPKGRWRLVPQATLATVVQWVSIILVRHSDSDLSVPFYPGWDVEMPPPARSREEARALVQSLAARAAAAPDGFARLAQEYSDERVTRDTGGSLGAMSGNSLLNEPSLLDALATLATGEVSRPIETRHGFVILHRRAPPDLATIAGRVLVVPYEIPGLRRALTEDKTPLPSRAEAQATARRLVTRIRADPAEFDRLVGQYHAPFPGGANGDLGQWTTREPGRLAREREQLAKLPIGGVTDALENLAGFTILLRTVPDDRQEYGMDAVMVSYNPNAPDDAEKSRKTVLALARSIARTVAAVPDRIGAFQSQYCCAGADRWSRGRTDAVLLDAAATLAIGAATPEPIDDGNMFVVARRVDLTSPDLPTIRFDLPAPKTADASELARAGFVGAGVEAAIRDLGKDASVALHLSPPDADRLMALHQQFASAFDAQESAVTRAQALGLFDDQLHVILTGSQYAKYRELADARVATKMMDTW